jgi:hypothetical protein
MRSQKPESLQFNKVKGNTAYSKGAPKEKLNKSPSIYRPVKLPGHVEASPGQVKDRRLCAPRPHEKPTPELAGAGPRPLYLAAGGQAAFSVTQIEWPKKVGQPPTSRNREEGVRFINQGTQCNLRELVMIIHLDPTSPHPTNVSAPITRDVHNCDFMNEMMARA